MTEIERKALVKALRPAKEDRCHWGFTTSVQIAREAATLIETQAREIERLREALERIGIYGCGMLSQPAAMNGPEETWLKQRIFEMERTARAALAGDSLHNSKGEEYND